jgi:hypothetical protein
MRTPLFDGGGQAELFSRARPLSSRQLSDEIRRVKKTRRSSEGGIIIADSQDWPLPIEIDIGKGLSILRQIKIAFLVEESSPSACCGS